MARMFCFGDSNTYGYDARSVLGERLPETQRWPDILQKLSGWEIINGGMNGRMIPQQPWLLEDFDQQLTDCGTVDMVLIMLGTNDLLGTFRPDMEKTGARMERFIRHVLRHQAIEEDGKKLLLVAPPRTRIGCFSQMDACYDRESEKFGICYRKIADRYGLCFADASAWELPLAHDGVHIAPAGHRIFAEKLWKSALLMQEP